MSAFAIAQGAHAWSLQRWQVWDPAGARRSADEFCSVIHLNRRLRMEGSTILAEFIGHHRRDCRAIAPDGFDFTEIVGLSVLGCIHYQPGWTLDGWILDESSHMMLAFEYYYRFTRCPRFLYCCSIVASMDDDVPPYFPHDFHWQHLRRRHRLSLLPTSMHFLSGSSVDIIIYR